MIHLDHISFVVLFLFGLGMCLKSLTYPIGTMRTPGAGLFPLFASILLMATSAFFLVHSFLKRERGEGAKASLFGGREAIQRVLLSVVSLVIFRYLLPFLGFAPSAFCFILCLSRFLAHYSWKASAFFAALSALGVYFLFQVLLKIQMPRGILGI
jgi:putative tricarboxylic transport membrane protein